MSKVRHLIEPTLRSRKIKPRKRYADGGGDLSDADQAAMMPETYVNPVAKGLVSGIGHMAMIPQRAIENSQNSLDTGNYDPGPTLDAAGMAIGAGAPMAEEGAVGAAGGKLVQYGKIEDRAGTPANTNAKWESPAPLTREERDWQNYGKQMSPDDVLNSEIVWAAGNRARDAGKDRAAAFAGYANDLWSKMGANRYISPELAAKYIRRQEGALNGIVPAKAGGGALSDLPDAPWATTSQASDLPDAPWATPSASTGSDVLKSAGVGAGKGLIDFAGTAGDAGNLLAKGSKAAGDYIGGLMGFEPSPELHAPVLPTSGGINHFIGDNPRTLSGQITGEKRNALGQMLDYQPQTTAGKFAGAITESAANPLSYVGPGGMAGKVAGAVATGAGSEGAGELAQKYAPEAEPYARIAGGLLGGAAAGTASAAVENTMRARGIPTTQELHNAADAAYDNARNLGVEYMPANVAHLRDDIERTLIQEGHRDDPLSRLTFARVRELGNSARGNNPDFSDIESVRKSLVRVRKQTNPNTGGPTEDARAAGIAIESIDDFLENPANAIPAHRGSGPLPQNHAMINGVPYHVNNNGTLGPRIVVQPNIAQQAAEFAAEGRGNWGAMARSQQIEAALSKGERNAAATGSGSNVDNALRQQVKNILNNPRRARNFTNDDRQIMESIVAGNPVRNSARLVSKLAATGIVSATGVIALGHLMGLGGAGVAALPAIGEGARRLGQVMTRSRYQRLLENIRMDSPVGQANPIGPRASVAPSIARAAATTPRLYVSPGSNPYAP